MSFSKCMDIVNSLTQEDQDAVLSKLDQYRSMGMAPERAQVAAVTDVLEEIKTERAEFVKLVEEQHPDYARRQVNFEVAPDPNDLVLLAAWRGLDTEQRLAISDKVARALVPKVLKLRKVSGVVLEQFGSYLDDTNPSFALKTSSGLVSEISSDLGYVLSQDSMMNISDESFPGAEEHGAVIVNLGDVDLPTVERLYNQLRQSIPAIGGQSFAQGWMTIINMQQYSGITTDDLIQKVDALIGKKYTVQQTNIYASFIEKDNYRDHQTLDGRGSEEAQANLWAGLDRLRSEAASAIRSELEAAGVRLEEGGAEEISKSARDQTETPEFKRWFGDWQDPKAFSSKAKGPTSFAVNKDGSPMVLYHATNGDFSTFEPGRKTINSTTFGDVETERHGIFTTPDVSFSQEYLKAVGGQNVMPVYMSIQAPIDMREGLNGEDETAIVENSDGKISRRDFYYMKPTEHWQVFDGDFGENFVEAARKAGFDGAIMSEESMDGERNHDVYVAFDSTQIKSATGNNGNFDGANPDIQKSTRDLGFYSELSKQIDKASMKQAPAAEWKSFIKALGQKGVKADEIEWSGVSDFLDIQTGKVAKQDILAYLDANGVQVQETVLEEPENVTEFNVYSRRGRDRRVLLETFLTEDEALDYVDEAEREDDSGDYTYSIEENANPEKYANGKGTKYEQYNLPGGESYREVLLTLPTNKPSLLEAMSAGELAELINRNDANADTDGLDRNDLLGMIKSMDLDYASMKRLSGKTSDVYKSSHWEQPNVLAHLRVDDRTDADGNKVLFVSELQSDWGQDGKKKGFNTPRAGVVKKNGDKYEIHWADGGVAAGYATEAGAQRDIAKYADTGKVPTAPFVTKTDGWLNLALKRAIIMAVEGGYDKVAFVNGEQSADRYSLGGQIDTLLFDPGDGKVVGRKNGGNVVTKTVENTSELPDLVGKEITDRLLASPKNGYGMHELSGVDLKLGGEGMKVFYDAIVPNAVKALLKKLGGGKVEPVRILIPGNKVDIDGMRTGAKRVDQTGFTITPEMAAKVEAGVPLFSRRDLIDTWTQYSEQDDAFKFGNTQLMQSKDLADVAQAFSTPDMQLTVSRYASDEDMVKLDVNGDQDNGWMALAQLYGAPRIKASSSTPYDAPGIENQGQRMYQALFAYAHNNGIKVEPDYELTNVNHLRRTSAMLSSALRFKTTRHLGAPGVQQEVENWSDNFEQNVAELALAEMRKVAQRVKRFNNFTINPKTGAVRYRTLLGDAVEAGGQAIPVDGRDADNEPGDGSGNDQTPDARSGNQIRNPAGARAARPIDRAAQDNANRSAGDAAQVVPRTGVQEKAVTDTQLRDHLASTGGGFGSHGVGVVTLKRALVTRQALESGKLDGMVGGLLYSQRDHAAVLTEESQAAKINPTKEPNDNFYTDLRRRLARDGSDAYTDRELVHALEGGKQVAGAFYRASAAGDDRGRLRIVDDLDVRSARGDNLYGQTGRVGKLHPGRRAYHNAIIEWTGDPEFIGPYITAGIGVRYDGTKGFLWLATPSNLVPNNPTLADLHQAFLDKRYATAIMVQPVDDDNWTVGVTGPQVGSEAYRQLASHIDNTGRFDADGNEYTQLKVGPAVWASWEREAVRRLAFMTQGWLPNFTFDRATGSNPRRKGRKIAAGDAEIRFSARDVELDDTQFSVRSGTSTWDMDAASGFDDIVFKLQNKMIDVRRVIQSITRFTGQVADDLNVYLQEELFHGRAAKRTEDFAAQELKPMMLSIKKAGYQLADVEEYLHARHAKEANRIIAQRNPGDPNMQDGGSGMTNAAAAAYMASLSPQDTQKLGAIAAEVDAILAKTRQLYVDYGLESQKTVNAWSQMFQHYIPLHREDKEGRPGIGQGFSVKGKETRGRTGSKRKVVDVLANIAMERERLIVRGEKNRVSKALYGLVRANPNPEFWDIGAPPSTRVYDPKTNTVVNRIDPMFKSKDNVVMVKVEDHAGNIVEQAVRFNEDEPRAMRMAAALKNLDAGGLEGLLGVSAKITRYFAAVNTAYNPVFGLVNLVRDVQGAMVNLGGTPLAKQKKRIALDTASALKGIYADIRAERQGRQGTSPWSQLFEEFQSEGGQTGFRDMFKSSADRAKDLEFTLNPDGWADSTVGKLFTANGTLKKPMTTAVRGSRVIFDWLSDYNTAMENGVRLAAYKAGLDQGMSKQQAASLAKNLTVNFNRKGNVGMQAGAVYAFFNAAMQGTARMGQTLFDMEPGKPKTIKLSSHGKKVVYGGMMLGSLQAFALMAAGFDDDDPPEFLRERSLIIPVSDGSYVSIPMPLGLHVIPGVGRHITEFALSGFEKPAQRAVSIIGMFADAFNPIGNAGLSMQTIAPTALDPFVALSENRDWTGKPIARTSMNKAVPGHTQWKDTATGPAKLLAEAINWASGGNEYVAGALSPTPDQIEYLVGQATGGVGRELMKVEQTVMATVRGEELPTFKVPLAGRFFGNTATQSSQAGVFYANSDRLNELETEIKGLRKDGKFQEAQALVQKHPEAVMLTRANVAERQIQRLRKEKRELIKQGAERAQIKQKETQITEVMTRLNVAMDKFK